MAGKLTLDDIKKMDKEFLTPAEVAEYLNAHHQCVREGIRAGVPWGYVLGKSRFVIPRKAFIHYHEKGAVLQIESEYFVHKSAPKFLIGRFGGS